MTPRSTPATRPGRRARLVAALAAAPLALALTLAPVGAAAAPTPTPATDGPADRLAQAHLADGTVNLRKWCTEGVASRRVLPWVCLRIRRSRSCR